LTGHPPILFGQPSFDEREEEAVLQVLRSRWIGQGPVVEDFESRLAAYVGARHAVAVASCTAALTLSLRAIGVGPGDEVVTTPFTFVATVNAIEHLGATPVLADIDRSTLNIDLDAVRGRLTEHTRAIVPVHFGGRPVNLPAFYELAEENDLWIVEDAAHALGAVADGKMVGGSGFERSLTCFSFYPNKNLASAEGGAVTLSDAEVADRIRMLRLHGLDNDAWKRYRESSARYSLAIDSGYKANWTDLQAAIGIVQLDKLEGFLASRENVARYYDAEVSRMRGVTHVDRGPDGLAWRHALHLYQVIVEGPAEVRDGVMAAMRSGGVGAAVHYIAVNHHPHYAGRLGSDGLPNSDWASSSLLTLPLHPELGISERQRVIEALGEAMGALS
jgi:dTDP-4-amino-4,6-dideoxygalactose transaminase